MYGSSKSEILCTNQNILYVSRTVMSRDRTETVLSRQKPVPYFCTSSHHFTTSPLRHSSSQFSLFLHFSSPKGNARDGSTFLSDYHNAAIYSCAMHRMQSLSRFAEEKGLQLYVQTVQHQAAGWRGKLISSVWCAPNVKLTIKHPIIQKYIQIAAQSNKAANVRNVVQKLNLERGRALDNAEPQYSEYDQQNSQSSSRWNSNGSASMHRQEPDMARYQQDDPFEKDMHPPQYNAYDQHNASMRTSKTGGEDYCVEGASRLMPPGRNIGGKGNLGSIKPPIKKAARTNRWGFGSGQANSNAQDQDDMLHQAQTSGGSGMHSTAKQKVVGPTGGRNKWGFGSKGASCAEAETSNNWSSCARTVPFSSNEDDEFSSLFNEE